LHLPQPWILPSVYEAEKQILDEHVNHEYANMAGKCLTACYTGELQLLSVQHATQLTTDHCISGPPSFCTGVPGFADVALKFILGEAKDSRPIAAVQSLSGTGALRLAGHFLHEYSPGKTLYLPTPTWGNHNKIFAQSSVPVNSYKYYDPETIGLDFDGMKHDIKQAPGGSVILLHACAHNPTGIDPSPEQWKELSDLIKDKEHLVLFDSAYQGFASGDAEADAFAVRLFLEEGHSMIIAQSFSKNFGLYGERVGALSVTAQSEDEADRITSQLKAAARAMYSNPPIHGAHIVKRILTDAKLESQWRQDCAHMAQRIQDMRTALVNSLEAAGSSLDWSHVTAQIGMFCYSGMSEAEVQRLGDEHHVYLTSNGRISMAGVTPDNVTYLAQAIHEVTTTLRK